MYPGRTQIMYRKYLDKISICSILSPSSARRKSSMNVGIERALVEGPAIKRNEVIPGVLRKKAVLVSEAGCSVRLSGHRFFSKNRAKAIFVGIGPPSILAAGILLLFLFVDHQVTAGSIYLSH